MSNPTHATNPAPDQSRPLRLWTALTRCPSLTCAGPARDALWLTVQDEVCTRGFATVTPLGSSAEIVVSRDYSSDELLAAMEWLHANEQQAKRLDPVPLYKLMRGAATRGAHGSGRAAQSDALHGMTEVPPGSPVRWRSLDEDGAA